MADEARRPNSTIYIGGLDTTHVTSSTLSEVFIPFGEIVDITLPKPEAPSSIELHRGFGYVEFEDASDAKEAVNNMDQSELYGRVIKVAMAKPEKREGGKAGVASTIAVWEQEGYLEQHGEGNNAATDDQEETNGGPDDPMHGLEGLDVAGPRPE